MRMRLWLVFALSLPLAGCGQIPLSSDKASPAASTADAPADTDLSGQSTGGQGQEASTAYPDKEAAEEAKQPAAEQPAPDASAAADKAGEGEASASSASAPGAADMLSTQELSRAQELALGSGELKSLAASSVDRDSLADQAANGDMEALSTLKDRPSYRLLYTQRLPTEKGAAPERAAEVAVFRYDTNTLERSKVDLASGKVEALATGPDQPAPLVPEEIAEAAAVARADAKVQAALKAAGLDPADAKANGILTVSDEDGSVCAVKRCVRLFFASQRLPLPAFNAVVNLSDLELVEVVDMPGFTEAQP